jgi:hypothetical protein
MIQFRNVLLGSSAFRSDTALPILIMVDTTVRPSR